MDFLPLLGAVGEQHAFSGENVFLSKCQILLPSADEKQKKVASPETNKYQEDF